MRPRLCGVLIVTAALMSGAVAGSVADAAEVGLALTGELPFSEDELRAAVDARAPAGADGLVIVVESAGGGDVKLRLGEKRSIVAVGDRTGEEAARVVAIAAVDLLLEEARLPYPPPAPVDTSPAMTTVSASAAPDRRADGLRVTLRPGVSRGTASIEPFTMTIDGDASLRIAWLRAVAGVAWWHVFTQDEGDPYEATFDAWAIRLGAGMRFGPFEVVAGGFVAPYSYRGLIEESGVLGGASVASRFAWKIDDRFSLVASAGADFHVNRFIAEVGGIDIFATPRVAFLVGVGLAWEVTQ